MAFKDHFSRQAAHYAAFRPAYPPALYAWLAASSPARRLAWDAGCGNGQAAVGLADHFERVEASDPSESQIARAWPHPRVRYHVAAESLPALVSGSVDLITVAQALHWFDRDLFAAEARRAAAPGALVAAWTYDLHRVDAAVDAVVDALYRDLDPWWPPERRHVEDGYAQLTLPGRALAVPAFAMSATWDLEHLLGYLGSWSAVAQCRARTGRDAVAEVRPGLAAAWGEALRERVITWPLKVLASRLR